LLLVLLVLHWLALHLGLRVALHLRLSVLLLLVLRLVALCVSVVTNLIALNAVGFLFLAVRVIVLLALVGELVDERGINSQEVDLEGNG
jgi:hypothetical protein